MTPGQERNKGWRENIDAAAAPPDFEALAAPVLALKKGTSMNEVYAVVAALCKALEGAARSTCQVVRDLACRHLREIVGIQSPASLFDSLLQEKRPQEERPSQVEDLIALAQERCELFHDGDGRAFAVVRTETHRETHPLRARSFARFLRSAYFERIERGVSEQAISDAIATLEGFAFRDGPVHEVFVRFGKDPNTKKVYLDLGDGLWRAVEIDAQGWRVVVDVPVRFLRPAGLRPLPEPPLRAKGSAPRLDPVAWNRFVHIHEADRQVAVAWLVAAILVRGPYVTLVLLGEQGSGKSSTARVLRILVDPVKAPLRSTPREERDIVIAAGNGGVVAFDNVSHLSELLADAMCRLSTGAGFSTRALYTNDEEYLFEGRRPQLLNGITNFISRDDLADRSAVLQVPLLKSPEPEEDFWTALEEARPELLADLLDLASATLARLPEARALLAGERAPRMADFTQVGVAADLALGGTGRGFLSRYREVLRGQAGEVLTDDPVGAAMLTFLAPGSEWRGTAAELLDALGRDEAARRRLPKTPRGLTAALDRLKPAFRRVGIAFERSGRGDERGIKFRRVARHAAPTGHRAVPDAESAAGPGPSNPPDGATQTNGVSGAGTHGAAPAQHAGTEQTGQAGPSEGASRAAPTTDCQGATPAPAPPESVGNTATGASPSASPASPGGVPADAPPTVPAQGRKYVL